MNKSNSYKSGLAPIYLRITVDGQRSEISTHRECEPEKWIKATGRMNGLRDNTKQLNAYLDSLVFKVRECEAAFLSVGETVTAEKLKNMLLGKSEKVNMLIPIFEYHNRQIEELVGREYALTTLTRYKTTLQHMINLNGNIEKPI